MVFLHMCFWRMVSKSQLYQLVRSDRASIVKRGWFLEPANQWLSTSSYTFGFGPNSSLTDPLCGLFYASSELGNQGFFNMFNTSFKSKSLFYAIQTYNNAQRSNFA